MNKLRNKFEKVELNLSECPYCFIGEDASKQCEQITDDFAVKYELFKIENNINFAKDGWCIYNNEHLTINELVLIFKTKYYE